MWHVQPGGLSSVMRFAIAVSCGSWCSGFIFLWMVFHVWQVPGPHSLQKYSPGRSSSSRGSCKFMTASTVRMSLSVISEMSSLSRFIVVCLRCRGKWPLVYPIRVGYHPHEEEVTEDEYGG